MRRTLEAGRVVGDEASEWRSGALAVMIVVLGSLLGFLACSFVLLLSSIYDSLIYELGISL